MGSRSGRAVQQRGGGELWKGGADFSCLSSAHRAARGTARAENPARERRFGWFLQS